MSGRRLLYDVLLELSEDDFFELFDIALDKSTRQSVNRTGSRKTVSRGLVLYFDVSYRGLGLLAAAIRSVVPALIDDTVFQRLSNEQVGRALAPEQAIEPDDLPEADASRESSDSEEPIEDQRDRTRPNTTPAGGAAPARRAERTRQAFQPNSLPFPPLPEELFVGREQALQELHRTLGRRSADRERDAASRTAAIVGKAVHGLGGVGKTRLAVEYAWQHAGDYSAVLFVVADSPASLWQNFANLGRPEVLALPETGGTAQEERVEAVFRRLRENPNWLLILDNIDTEEAAAEIREKLLPRLAGGSVLVTSRLSWWGDHVDAIALDVLPVDEAARFLLEKTRPQGSGRGRLWLAGDEKDAADLAWELDGLALALEQAAAYIVHQRISLAEYVRRWKERDTAVWTWQDDRTPQQKRVAQTFETTLRQLGRRELAILNLFAWMAPEPIPLFLLGDYADLTSASPEQRRQDEAAAGRLYRQAVELLSPDPEAVSNGETVRDSLRILADFGICYWDAAAGTATLHRVVQEVLRARQGSRDVEWLTLALRLLDAARPAASPSDVRTWPVWDRLRPHVALAASEADERKIAGATAAALMRELGKSLKGKALHDEAERWQRRALALAEVVDGPDSPEVAVHLSLLARTLRDTNRRSEAEPLFRRALAIDERSFKLDDPRVAIQLSNLALLLQDDHRLAEAEPLIRRALAIDEGAPQSDPHKVAIRLNNLAGLLQTTNRLREAEPLFRRALDLDRGVYGEDHPEVAIRLGNLGLLLVATSRSSEAEPLLRRALAIYESTSGEKHPSVAIALRNLALWHRAADRLPEAERLIRRSLAINEASFGADHPRVARDLNILAGLLEATDRPAEGEPLIRRALAIDEKSYGTEHPCVARDLGTLASLLLATNRPSEGEPLARRALAIDEEAFGAEHPDVARDLAILSSVLHGLGRLSEAEPLLRRTLRIQRDFQERCGHEHPQLRAALRDYSALLRRMGRSDSEVRDGVKSAAGAGVPEDWLGPRPAPRPLLKWFGLAAAFLGVVFIVMFVNHPPDPPKGRWSKELSSGVAQSALSHSLRSNWGRVLEESGAPSPDKAREPYHAFEWAGPAGSRPGRIGLKPEHADAFRLALSNGEELQAAPVAEVADVDPQSQRLRVILLVLSSAAEKQLATGGVESVLETFPAAPP